MRISLRAGRRYRKRYVIGRSIGSRVTASLECATDRRDRSTLGDAPVPTASVTLMNRSIGAPGCVEVAAGGAGRDRCVIAGFGGDVRIGRVSGRIGRNLGPSGAQRRTTFVRCARLARSLGRRYLHFRTESRFPGSEDMRTTAIRRKPRIRLSGAMIRQDRRHTNGIADRMRGAPSSGFRPAHVHTVGDRAASEGRADTPSRGMS